MAIHPIHAALCRLSQPVNSQRLPLPPCVQLGKQRAYANQPRRFELKSRSQSRSIGPETALTQAQPLRVLMTRSRRSPDHAPTTFNLPDPNSSAQYRSRGKVTVAWAGISFASSFFTAWLADSWSAKSPNTAEPDPESDTYFAPDLSSARLTSRIAGYLGKTTPSKSFSIPVRTRSRSSASARSRPLPGTPVGVKLPFSHS